MVQATQHDRRSSGQQSAYRYQCLFAPKSIAVIGASGDALKPGGRVFKTILDHGYEGRLWPVNPKSSEIFGVPAYPELSQLPEAPQLAIIAIPSKFVPGAVQELAAMGTGAVIVLTSGFGEKDEAGKCIEREMCAIADSANMALIGPNCSGFLTRSYKGKFAGLVPTLPGGAVDFISGSGATVDYVMECAEGRGLSFGTVINLGNSAMLGVEDLLALYDENYAAGQGDQGRILMLYMEAVKKPQLLLHHARSLVAKGCILVGIKSGATSAGSRAAASHTGAMATSDTAVEALFARAGIIRVRGRGELVDVACVLQAARGRLRGGRVCIVTDAGGPGVMLADELTRCGLELPPLGAQATEALGAILPRESSLANPVDALPSRTASQIAGILEILDKYEGDNLDAVVVLVGDSGLADNGPIYDAIAAGMDNGSIPVLPMLSSLTSCRDKIASFTRSGRVFFPDEVALGHAMGAVHSWKAPESAATNLENYDKDAIAAALQHAEGALSPELSRQILEAAGFRLPGQCVVKSKEQLDGACEAIGFPLVMKVIGPLHKTDVGGVKVGIADDTAALAVFDELMDIRDASGVLLQPMIDGIEVILGVSREGDFGHLVMFGLGGIWAEVLKDVRFALAPLGRTEAARMIDGIRSRKLLDGVRGGQGMAVDVLADYLVRLSLLVFDFPQIGEIDLNPVKGCGPSLYAVDGRIIVS